MKLCTFRLGLSIMLVIFLALPFIQKGTKTFPHVSLTGREKHVEKPNWSIKSWLNGKAAREFEAHFTATIGFRGLFVKALNQFNFLAFGNITANKGTSVILGKDCWLYENTYVKHYRKRHGMGKKSTRKFLKDLKSLQDKLAERDIRFLFLISPSKAEIYPEYLPDNVVISKEALERQTAYELFAPQLADFSINHLDATAFFKKQKPTTDALFTRTGTHWTYYGSFLVIQELLSKINNFSEHTYTIPKITSLNHMKPLGTDNDLELLLNLFWFIPKNKSKIPYPVVETDSLPMKQRNNILLIGDSFAFTLVDSINLAKIAHKIDLFYYFKRLYSYTCEENPGYAYTH